MSLSRGPDADRFGFCPSPIQDALETQGISFIAQEAHIMSGVLVHETSENIEGLKQPRSTNAVTVVPSMFSF